MKTLHLLIGFIFLTTVPFGCEGDVDPVDSKIEEIESGEVVVEFKLEEFALETELFNLKQNAETEDDKERIAFIEERLKVIKQGVVMLEIGPVPGPRPCSDQPSNCPIPLFELKRLLVQDKFQKFGLTVMDPKTQEVVFMAEESEESELINGFIEFEFDYEELGIEEMLFVTVTKIIDEQDLSYSFFAVPKV